MTDLTRNGKAWTTEDNISNGWKYFEDSWEGSLEIWGPSSDYSDSPSDSSPSSTPAPTPESTELDETARVEDNTDNPNVGSAVGTDEDTVLHSSSFYTLDSSGKLEGPFNNYHAAIVSRIPPGQGAFYQALLFLQQAFCLCVSLVQGLLLDVSKAQSERLTTDCTRCKRINLHYDEREHLDLATLCIATFLGYILHGFSAAVTFSLIMGYIIYRARSKRTTIDARLRQGLVSPVTSDGSCTRCSLFDEMWDSGIKKYCSISKLLNFNPKREIDGPKPIIEHDQTARPDAAEIYREASRLFKDVGGQSSAVALALKNQGRDLLLRLNQKRQQVILEYRRSKTANCTHCKRIDASASTSTCASKTSATLVRLYS